MKKFLLSIATLMVAGSAFADNMALKVTCAAAKDNPWDSQVFINFPKSVEAGKSYTLLMDVMGSVALEPRAGQYGPEAIQPIVQDNNSDNRDEWGGPADLQYLAHFTVTTDWVKNVKDCEGNDLVTDGAFPYSRLLLNLGLFAGDIYVDNVRLVDEAGVEAFCITFDTKDEQALVENGWMNLPKSFVAVEGGEGSGDEPGADEAIWEGSVEMGSSWPSVQIAKAQLGELHVGDKIVVTATGDNTINAGWEWGPQVFVNVDWKSLAGTSAVSFGDGETVEAEFEITEEGLAQIEAANEIEIQGQNSVVTKVVLVCAEGGEPEIVKNCIVNDNVEAGQQIIGWGGSMSISVVEEDGNHYYAINNPTAADASWGVQVAYDTEYEYLVGTEYFMEFDIKGEVAGTTFSAGLQNTNGYKGCGEFGNVSVTTEWQHVTLKTTCTGEGATRLVISIGDYAGVLSLDNVEVYTASEAGLDNIVAEPIVNGIFDMNGRQVTTMERGLYIVNGKKVLVR